ncbi:MAG: DUF4254 domain-containing protein [Legionellales bacterium]|nr:DUF4254 domain-containing protein [Legionellales bacterium]
MMINPTTIVKLHRQLTLDWHQSPPTVGQTGWLALVAQNHLHNFQLWHEEDKARRDDQGFEYVYHAKRNIDHHNQQRNNLMEAMDQFLYQQLQPAQADCPFNSETPGMMIDRLSILALKDYHMAEQTQRKDVEQSHLDQCQLKLDRIHQQLTDLQQCLQQLIDEVIAKRRSFHIYYQCKMYNDPQLNPQLYTAATPD